MAELPAFQPRLPFIGKIPGGLRHGVMIRINGILTPKPDGLERFSINLLCKPAIKPLGDVPLHIDVRLGKQSIVRNTHSVNTGWGHEERLGGCPIQRGQQYDILILAQSNFYKIAINGSHFCEYFHRLPMQRVQFIHVKGDSTVTNIRMEQDFGPGQVGFATAPPFPVGEGPPFQHVAPPKQYAPSYATPAYSPPAYSPPAYNPPAYSPPTYNPPPYNPAVPIHQPILSSPPYNAQIPPQTTPGSYGYGNYPSGNTYGSGVVTMNKDTSHFQEDKKNKKYLKYAAIAGGVGLGAYALSRVIRDSNDSD